MAAPVRFCLPAAAAARSLVVEFFGDLTNRAIFRNDISEGNEDGRAFGSNTVGLSRGLARRGLFGWHRNLFPSPPPLSHSCKSAENLLVLPSVR